MKSYAFFYNKQGVRPLGDRSVIAIDGRLNTWRTHEVAGEECLRRGFHAYNVVQAAHLRDVPVHEMDTPARVYYPVRVVTQLPTQQETSHE